MNINIREYQGTLLAEVAGELDGSHAPELRETLFPLLRKGAILLLDMAQTTFMSSAGLRAMLLLHRQARAQGAQLVLVGLSWELRDVMSSTGFLSFFCLANTPCEAAQIFTL